MIIISEWEQYTSGFYGKFVLWIPARPSIGAEALDQGIVTHRRSPVHHVTPFSLPQAPCVLAGVGDDSNSAWIWRTMDAVYLGPVKQAEGQISYKNSGLYISVITPGDQTSPSPHAGLGDFKVLEGSNEERSSQKQNFKTKNYSLTAETRGPWETHRYKEITGVKVTADDIQSKSSGKPRSSEVKQAPYPTGPHRDMWAPGDRNAHSQYLMGEDSIPHEDPRGCVGAWREV